MAGESINALLKPLTEAIRHRHGYLLTFTAKPQLVINSGVISAIDAYSNTPLPGSGNFNFLPHIQYLVSALASIVIGHWVPRSVDAGSGQRPFQMERTVQSGVTMGKGKR